METNGLLKEVTEIWCIVIYDTNDNTTRTYYDGPASRVYTRSGGVNAAVQILVGYNGAICGHNIAGYDVPVMKKLRPQITKPWPDLLPCTSGEHMMMDTYMLSCLMYPQQQEHGLDYWGKVLGTAKPVQEDWSQLSKDMLHRCQQDVAINVKLLAHLKKRKNDLRERTDLDWFFSDALELEQYVQQIHAQQEVHGVRYDILKAVKLKEELDVRMNELRKIIVSQAPWHVVHPFTVEVKKPYKINGDYSKAVVDWFGSEKECDKAGIQGPFSRIRFDPMNIDSDQQVKNYLLSLGWKPTEWNISKKTRKRTSPKLTEDSYGSLPPGVGRRIAEYRICAHRRGLILNRKGDEKGGLWAVQHRGDGRVPAEAFTCGTPTSRYRHKGTVCNIPRPSSPYGEEIRELFCVPDTHTQLGLDLKGIEIRMAAHFAFPYHQGKEFADLVLDGDFHSNNASIWTCDRNDAKTGLYALMYGCTPPKLAQSINKPINEGQMHYDRFWQAYPALAELRSDLELRYKRSKCLKGLDGRRLDIREDRKLLNTLIQGGSAVVFKLWMYKNHLTIQSGSMGAWAHQIIAYHDELQYELYSQHPGTVQNLAKCFQDNALEVGRFLKINVPIEADAKIGSNWRECH